MHKSLPGRVRVSNFSKTRQESIFALVNRFGVSFVSILFLSFKVLVHSTHQLLFEDVIFSEVAKFSLGLISILHFF